MSEHDEQPGLNFEETTTHEGRERRIKMRPSGIFVFTDQPEPKPEVEAVTYTIKYAVSPNLQNLKLRHIHVPGKFTETVKITDPKLKLQLTRKA